MSWAHRCAPLHHTKPAIESVKQVCYNTFQRKNHPTISPRISALREVQGFLLL